LQQDGQNESTQLTKAAKDQDNTRALDRQLQEEETSQKGVQQSTKEPHQNQTLTNQQKYSTPEEAMHYISNQEESKMQVDNTPKEDSTSTQKQSIPMDTKPMQ